jgi:hypothetical protein
MMFTSEEPTRFKLSCVGSRAMAGALAADTLDVKLDENGTSFLEVSRLMNFMKFMKFMKFIMKFIIRKLYLKGAFQTVSYGMVCSSGMWQGYGKGACSRHAGLGMSTKSK